MTTKQQQCPICLSIGIHTFPCEEGTPVLVEDVVSASRGPLAKVLDDARREAGIKVLFLADRALVDYERMRAALRGKGALTMPELDRVLTILGLSVVKSP
jgi:hypothetical protein